MINHDPVKHCPVYKSEGCAHVDGMFCNMSTCSSLKKPSSAEVDTLVALVEEGPLWDGDVPSKTGRDALIVRGEAVRIMVKGNEGYTAATYAGREAYKALFGPTPGVAADTTHEATVNRKAQL